jgi:hypothetical protein
LKYETQYRQAILKRTVKNIRHHFGEACIMHTRSAGGSAQTRKAQVKILVYGRNLTRYISGISLWP